MHWHPYFTFTNNPATPPTPPVVIVTPSGPGGSKPRKKIRGPYSDPRIFEEYVERCIAERNAPRADTAKAQLQEALLHEVETRRQQDIVALDTLVRENEALAALLEVERSRRDVLALNARIEQIGKQVKALQEEQDDIAAFAALWQFMDTE